MFSEILKIIPKIDGKDLQAMERALSARFKKVAKGFGKGLAGAIKGGGIAGIGLALIDKILNPLKEVQDAIDRTLKSNDDVSTNAKQFNTTSGKLRKVTALGEATGLSAEDTYKLISKFQGAVAGYNNNPLDPANSAVANFAKIPDIADGFFQFIQSLQKIEDKNYQRVIQEQVFGEKQVLKMADFLNSNFPKLFKDVGLDKLNSTQLSKAIEKLADLNDLTDVLSAKRGLRDTVDKGAVINRGMVTARDRSEQIALARENDNISRYRELAAISDAMAKIQAQIEKGLGLIGTLVEKITPLVERLADQVGILMKSPLVKGVGSWFQKKGD